MKARWFFFYGTLMDDHDNPLTRRILPLMSLGETGIVQGKLLAVRDPRGWYPLLVHGRGQVLGRLYRAGPRFSERAIHLMDAYERYDPRAPARSEYVRKSISVRRAGSRIVRAEAYIARCALRSGMPVIASGSFTAFLKQRRLKAFT